MVRAVEPRDGMIDIFHSYQTTLSNDLFTQCIQKGQPGYSCSYKNILERGDFNLNHMRGDLFGSIMGHYRFN